MRERELYSLGMPELEMFTFKSKQAFEIEKQRVLASATRQQRARPTIRRQQRNST
jgi:hypothetical protein